MTQRVPLYTELMLADANRMRSKPENERTPYQVNYLRAFSRLEAAEAAEAVKGRSDELEAEELAALKEMNEVLEGLAKSVTDLSDRVARANLDEWETKARTELEKSGWKPGMARGKSGRRLAAAEDVLVGVRLVREMMDRASPGAIMAAGMGLSMGLTRMGIGGQREAVESIIQSQRSSGKRRRPRLRTRAILAALAEGNDTPEAVQGFFRDNLEIRDKWGEIEISCEGGVFYIIDIGAALNRDGMRPAAELTVDDLPKLIQAAVTKRR